MEPNLPYNAVMVDLETMGRGNNAAIISIGAVRFWLNVTQEVFTQDQLYHNIIDLETSQQAGLDVDADTVKWWLSQDKEAQSALTDKEHMWPLEVVLKTFKDFCPKDALLFGNGATFDNVILRNAFAKAKIDYPISYRNDMCYRTVSRMSGVEFPPFVGTKHNALDDAKMQTWHLMRILQKYPWIKF